MNNRINPRKKLVSAVRSIVEGLEDRRLLAATALLSESDHANHPGVLDTLTITGTSGDDVLTLLKSNGQVKAGLNGVAKIFSDPTDIIQYINLNSLGGDDTIVLNTGIARTTTIDPGDSAENNVLYINGMTSGDAITLGTGSVSLFTGKTASFTNSFQKVYLDARGGGDTVTASAGVYVTISHTQHFQSLTLGAGAKVNLDSNSASTLFLKAAPTLGTGAFINVNDNAMIVDYTGGTSPYAALRAQIQSGLVLLNPTATTGIDSSDVDLQIVPGTMLSIVDNGFVGGEISNRSFAADIPPDSVIIMYTWFGDADLNGVVNGGDYILTDTGFSNGTGLPSHWVFGDFDYDGENGGMGDYLLLDTGFVNQTVNPLAIWAPSPTGVVGQALSSSEVKLTWTAPTKIDANENTVAAMGANDYYMIYATENGDNYKLIGTTKSTTYQFYSNFNGNVQFVVTAHIGNMISPVKTAKTTGGADAELSLTKAISNAHRVRTTENSATIAWTANAINITGYLIRYAPVDENGIEGEKSFVRVLPSLSQTGTERSYTITGLSPDTDYNVTITPYNASTPGNTGYAESQGGGTPNNNEPEVDLPGGEEIPVITSPEPWPGYTWVYNSYDAPNGFPRSVDVEYAPMEEYTTTDQETGVTTTYRYQKHLELGNETLTLTVSNLPKHAFVTYLMGFKSNYTLDENKLADLSMTVDGQTVTQTSPSTHNYAYNLGWVQTWAYEGYYSNTGLTHTDDSVTFEITGSGFDQSYRWGGYDGPGHMAVAVYLPEVKIVEAHGGEEAKDLADYPTNEKPGIWIERSMPGGAMNDLVPAENVTVEFSGTGDNPGSPGVDIAETSVTVALGAGVGRIFVPITILDDPDAEGDEEISAAIVEADISKYPTFESTTQPGTQPTSQPVKVPLIEKDNVSVRSLKLTLVRPNNYFDGYDFYAQIDLVGERLDLVNIHQLIKSSTSIQDYHGQTLSLEQMLAIADADSNSVVLDTDGGMPEDDRWEWARITPTAGSNNGIATLADHQVLDLPSEHWGPPNSGIDIAYLCKLKRLFKLELCDSRKPNGEKILMDHTWGYDWSNENCLWMVPQEDDFLWCASSWNHAKGIFTNTKGIAGLEELSGNTGTEPNVHF